jgi:hypothetical protein
MSSKVSKIIMTSKAAQTLSLLEVKSIIFGLSVFNFMFIWGQSRERRWHGRSARASLVQLLALYQ